MRNFTSILISLLFAMQSMAATRVPPTQLAIPSGTVVVGGASNVGTATATGTLNQVLTSAGGTLTPIWKTLQAGVKNYISGGDAESGAGLWATYKDAAGVAPVDGVGGVPTLSQPTVSSTAPLADANSFLLVHPTSNTQGEGFAPTDFTIDSYLQAKMVKISFDYLISSGTFVAGSDSVNSDIMVYVYDVTNAKLVDSLSVNKLYSNSSTLAAKYEATFQAAYNSTVYRLILHNATTTTAAFTLKVDNIAVNPSTGPPSGSITTPWAQYTMTIGGTTTAPTKGTVAVDKAFWRRVGDSMEITYNYRQTAVGAAGSGTYYFPLPSGYVVDTTKLGVLSSVGTLVGSAQAYAGSIFTGTVWYLGSSALSIQVSNDTTAVNSLGSGFAGLGNGTVEYSFAAKVPIVGWDIPSQISDGYDGRQIGAKYTISGSQTITDASITTMIWNSTAGGGYDDLGAMNTSTGVYTFKSAGRYLACSGLNTTGSVSMAAANRYSVNYRISGGSAKTLSYNIVAGTVTEQPMVAGCDFINVVAGDYLEIVAYFDLNAANYNIGGSSYFSINKMNGSATVAVSPTVNAIYTSTAAQSFINGSNNIINMATKEEDSFGAVTTGASWQFVAPTPGIYEVVITQTLSVGSSTAYGFQHLLYKNGAAAKYGPVMNGTTSSLSSNFGMTSTMQVRLNTGDYITPYLYNFSGANKNASANGNENHITIKKIGN